MFSRNLLYFQNLPCLPLITFTSLVPSPDFSLRHPYFDVHSSPSTTAAQRRNMHGWVNNWPLQWRRILRHGRVNRQSGEQTTEDAVLPAPINITAYLGSPSVWPDLSMGEFFPF